MKWAISIALGLVVIASHAGRCEAGKAKARQLYEQGVKQYNLGDFEPALESFRAAYTEYSEPTILFNLAQCERQLGNKAKAVTLYRSYLRELPDAENASDVRRIVSSLEQEQHEQAMKAPPPETAVVNTMPRSPAAPTTTGSVSPDLVIAAHSESPKRSHRKAWVWGVVAGAAVVAIGVGLGVGLGLSSDHYPSPSAGTGVLR